MGHLGFLPYGKSPPSRLLIPWDWSSSLSRAYDWLVGLHLYVALSHFAPTCSSTFSLSIIPLHTLLLPSSLSNTFRTLPYPLHTPQEAAYAPVVCPTEILAFNKAIADFQAIGAEIIVSSTDSEFTHLAWSQMNRKEGGLGPDLKLTMVRSKLVELWPKLWLTY